MAQVRRWRRSIPDSGLRGAAERLGSRSDRTPLPARRGVAAAGVSGPLRGVGPGLGPGAADRASGRAGGPGPLGLRWVGRGWWSL